MVHLDHLNRAQEAPTSVDGVRQLSQTSTRQTQGLQDLTLKVHFPYSIISSSPFHPVQRQDHPQAHARHFGPPFSPSHFLPDHYAVRSHHYWLSKSRLRAQPLMMSALGAAGWTGYREYHCQLVVTSFEISGRGISLRLPQLELSRLDRMTKYKERAVAHKGRDKSPRYLLAKSSLTGSLKFKRKERSYNGLPTTASTHIGT